MFSSPVYVQKYFRGSLKPQTIINIFDFIFSSRFDQKIFLSKFHILCLYGTIESCTKFRLLRNMIRKYANRLLNRNYFYEVKNKPCISLSSYIYFNICIFRLQSITINSQNNTIHIYYVISCQYFMFTL